MGKTGRHFGRQTHHFECRQKIKKHLKVSTDYKVN